MAQNHTISTEPNDPHNHSSWRTFKLAMENPLPRCSSIDVPLILRSCGNSLSYEPDDQRKLDWGLKKTFFLHRSVRTYADLIESLRHTMKEHDMICDTRYAKVSITANVGNGSWIWRARRSVNVDATTWEAILEDAKKGRLEELEIVCKSYFPVCQPVWRETSVKGSGLL